MSVPTATITIHNATHVDCGWPAMTSVRLPVPVSGIARGLRDLSTPSMVIALCEMPLLPPPRAPLAQAVA